MGVLDPKQSANAMGPTQACFAMKPEVLTEVFSPETLGRIRRLANVAAPVFSGEEWADYGAMLRDAEVLFSSWGAPVLDREFLETAKNLKAVFHAAGSVRFFSTPEMWRRGIRVSSAYAFNAIPVCEYTTGAILLGLKHFWHYARKTRETRSFPADRPVIGGYGARVGLVSYGTIARLVRERLRACELEVLVYDPYLSEEEAARDDVKRVSLDELFAESDVVSVHTPLLERTTGLIGRAQFERMKRLATFINTARGEILQEAELVAFLRDRPDVQAILDVSVREPPELESPLYDLPNVALTPHISGSLGAECRRLGDAMADEYERYLAGRPLRWELDEEKVASMA